MTLANHIMKFHRNMPRGRDVSVSYLKKPSEKPTLSSSLTGYDFVISEQLMKKARAVS